MCDKEIPLRYIWTGSAEKEMIRGSMPAVGCMHLGLVPTFVTSAYGGPTSTRSRSKPVECFSLMPPVWPRTLFPAFPFPESRA